jgi:hypothetical protein
MNNLHPVFQQALAPFAPPPEIDIKKRVRDAIAAGKDPIIEHAGDTWRVMGIGVASSGAHLCHLASTTRFQAPQKNGIPPVQTLDWVPNEILADAVSRVHQ